MITSRRLEETDRMAVEAGLAQDDFHKGTTTVDFWYDPKGMSNIYEDESGPILVLKGTKALRLDIQFLDNNDTKRNAKALLDGFGDLVQKARQAGFTEICFNSDSESLIKFCKSAFGYHEVDGELRLYL